jgi:predicted DNA-binding ribbon-helix-helix protein
MAKKTASAKIKKPTKDAPIPIERVQLGVRLERSMVKVLKAMAEYGDMSLGELLEEIVLHSFEGGSAQTFEGEDLKTIAEFKRLYGMNYDVHSNYKFVEKS